MSLNDLDNNGIALDGMDPVSYKNSEGLLGSPEFTYDLRGITYRFANKQNLELFQKDPAVYIPDFAGSYVRNTRQATSADVAENVHRHEKNEAYLESRGMLDDVIDPEKGNIDPAMRSNPGYESNNEVEQSNLSDSES